MTNNNNYNYGRTYYRSIIGNALSPLPMVSPTFFSTPLKIPCPAFGIVLGAKYKSHWRGDCCGDVAEAPFVSESAAAAAAAVSVDVTAETKPWRC
jgi:hypothetical protein